jgi:hypothetical protein
VNEVCPMVAKEDAGSEKQVLNSNLELDHVSGSSC